MDRTMYGKFDPGARQPYRTVRAKGIQPGYALLADLQNSVPGHSPYQQQQPPPQSYQHQQPHQTHQQSQAYVDSSGYGSLRGRAAPPPQLQTSYQEPYSTIDAKSASSPTTRGGYNNNGPNIAVSPSTSQGYQQQQQGSLPRGIANAGAYNRNNGGGLGGAAGTQSPHNNQSISELDSLLHDLSNGRYDSYEKESIVPAHNNYNNGHAAAHKYNSYNSYSEERPSVDSLLSEMDNASIYAVPHGARTPKSPTPGRHVTITVRETKTEKVSGPDGPVGSIEENIVEQKDTFTPNNAAYPMYASSATKELDDLMASLSDFKVNNGSNHHHQTVTDYAKPNKGISQVTQTITETTIVEDAPPTPQPQPDQLDSMLGSLQANMSRQGVNTVQKGSCSACEKPIVGQVITALGKTWHPEHFTCNHCSQELGTRNFFERDGLPYCEADYHNLFSPRCAYCNGAILDKCVTALEKTWHTEHFFCAQCGQQFGEDGFHERDGKPYCRNDYFEMFAPKCNGCNRAIMENYISALNSQWHPDCFVCRDCKKAVRGKSFYAMEGKPVCPTCVGVDEEE